MTHVMCVVLVRIRTFCSFLVCKQGASVKQMIRGAIDRQAVLLCSLQDILSPPREGRDLGLVVDCITGGSQCMNRRRLVNYIVIVSERRDIYDEM